MQTATPFDPESPAQQDEKRDALVRGIESAASALHQKADSLPGGGRVASSAHATAGAMEAAADYLRDHDLQDVVTDVRRVVKKHPGATLLIATAVGFLLARAFSRH